MEEITLNLIPSGIHPTCHVSQDDNERNIKVNLVNGNLAYIIQSNDIFKLNIRKPNGHVISSAVSKTAGNTYVVINVTDDMCDVDGDNLCELRITNGNTRISTSNFVMNVETSPSSGGEFIATNLSDLRDVDIDEATLDDNQVLTYDEETEKWVNAEGGSGGSSTFADLDDVSLSNLQNGQVPKWNSTTEKWENADESGGGSGGHTIIDDGGTSLTQRSSLQFKGAYSEDNSTDEITEVNVVREMTKDEFDLLSDDEKAGLINITDEAENGFYHEYSTSEQIVGKWIDGSTLYEKTVTTGGSVPSGATLIERIVQTGYDTLHYIKSS